MSINKKFDNIQIGKRLKEVRKKTGKSLEKMGEITGLSKSGISDMEKGLKKPSTVYMHALNIKFGININWILTGKGAMSSPDIELNLNFGIDNDIIKNLIFCIEHVDVIRYDILKYFSQKKDEYQEFIKKIKEEKEQ